MAIDELMMCVFDRKFDTPLGRVSYLVIRYTKEGWFLVARNDNNEDVGDTWHQSLDDAMHQAEVQYDVDRDSWFEIPNSTLNLSQYAELMRGKQG